VRGFAALHAALGPCIRASRLRRDSKAIAVSASTVERYENVGMTCSRPASGSTISGSYSPCRTFHRAALKAHRVAQMERHMALGVRNPEGSRSFHRSSCARASNRRAYTYAPHLRDERLREWRHSQGRQRDAGPFIGRDHERDLRRGRRCEQAREGPASSNAISARASAAACARNDERRMRHAKAQCVHADASESLKPNSHGASRPRGGSV